MLICFLLADRRVKILADRGVHARVGPDGWEPIGREMEQAFRNGASAQVTRPTGSDGAPTFLPFTSGSP